MRLEWGRKVQQRGTSIWGVTGNAKCDSEYDLIECGIWWASGQGLERGSFQMEIVFNLLEKRVRIHI